VQPRYLVPLIEPAENEIQLRSNLEEAHENSDHRR